VVRRGLGAARSGDVAQAKKDLERITALRDTMTQAKNAYWAEQSEIQRLAVAAWIAKAEGKKEEALALMRQSADREDATEKHPVTPGALFPAREMLATCFSSWDSPRPPSPRSNALRRTTRTGSSGCGALGVPRSSPATR
jgi:hypothetical protein